jgi:hypothetical protein
MITCAVGLVVWLDFAYNFLMGCLEGEEVGVLKKEEDWILSGGKWELFCFHF